jgi:hypothetical protein
MIYYIMYFKYIFDFVYNFNFFLIRQIVKVGVKKLKSQIFGDGGSRI